LNASKNRLALARHTAASIGGKHRGEAGIHFASLAARGVLTVCLHGLRKYKHGTYYNHLIIINCDNNNTFVTL
jgi:hypothetical protein